ncbi:MAG: hypothetical protein IKZ25_00300, partial [Clostridia bacterium]|nr:hypothetical protein [Clostridia bacterium]
MEKRVVSYVLLICLCFCVLSFRLYDLTINSNVIQSASSRQKYTLTLKEERGIIYDRNFEKLVENEWENIAIVNPLALKTNSIDFLNKNSSDMAKEELNKKITKERPFLTTVNIFQKDLPGIKIYGRVKRYSENGLLSHLIGYCDGDGNGVSGIEKAFNEELKTFGGKTKATFLVDAKRKALGENNMEILKTSNAQGGIVLTIDKNIQEIAEKAIDNNIKKGAVVISDIESGEILALVSRPDYDPNNVKDYLQRDDAPFLNRCFNNYNLGSVFKICVVAAALENKVSTTFEVNCKGYIEIAGRNFGCHKKEGHGEVSLETAFKESCNPYFIELCNRTGADKVISMAKKLGFSEENIFWGGICSPKGNLPIKSKYTPHESANISIGQGEILVTPIQVNSMISTIASKGIYRLPVLFKGITKDGKNISLNAPACEEYNILDPSIASKICDLMKKTVEDGSGRRANPENLGAGGKTASAQTGQFKNGEEIIRTWFSGFYPENNPKYAITII